MRMYALFLFLHVLGTVVWVGGMVVMHFAVRPAAVALLAPPQRLPLMAAALQRFFALVTVSALVVLISGLAMLIGIGMAAAGAVNPLEEGLRLAHPSVHAMFALGLLMMVIYAVIRGRLFPKMQRAVAAQDWPAAARPLDRIRQLVLTNLCLGVLVIAIATLGRAVL